MREPATDLVAGSHASVDFAARGRRRNVYVRASGARNLPPRQALAGLAPKPLRVTFDKRSGPIPGHRARSRRWQPRQAPPVPFPLQPAGYRRVYRAPSGRRPDRRRPLLHLHGAAAVLRADIAGADATGHAAHGPRTQEMLLEQERVEGRALSEIIFRNRASAWVGSPFRRIGGTRG